MTDEDLPRSRGPADHHVGDGEVSAILDFMQELLALLKMTQYRILMMWNPSDDDCYASIDFVDGRFTAQLYLNKEWSGYHPDIKFNTIIHETLHITHRTVNDVVEDQAHHMLYPAYADFRRRFQEQMEFFVDHYATFMEDNYDLREYWDKCYAKYNPKGDPDMKIEVDDLPVTVDDDEYKADPEKVIASVRAAREALRIPDLPDNEREPDYNQSLAEEGLSEDD